MNLVCPNSGRDVRDDAAVSCPCRGTSLLVPPTLTTLMKRTGFPIVAGVLTIISAFVSIIIGILGIIVFWASISSDFNGLYYQWLVMGIFAVLAFVFGLTGGIFSIKRRHFALSIIGASLVLVSGFVTLFAFGVVGYGTWISGTLFWLPIIVLSFAGIIFAAMSKHEFA